MTHRQKAMANGMKEANAAARMIDTKPFLVLYVGRDGGMHWRPNTGEDHPHLVKLLSVETFAFIKNATERTQMATIVIRAHLETIPEGFYADERW